MHIFVDKNKLFYRFVFTLKIDRKGEDIVKVKQKVGCKFVIAWLFCFLFTLLYGQQLQITYPDYVSSSPRLVVNIPILCENTSNQSVTIHADYFNTFGDFDKSYTINQITPKTIAAGRKELIFLSLLPNVELLAGKRFFPFSICDTNNNVLVHGVVDISHTVAEDFDIIPLSDSHYLVQDEVQDIAFLFVNRGSVPVEFKMKHSQEAKVIQPGIPDTLRLNLSDISSLQRHTHWINVSIDYYLTKILPTGLVVQEHTLYSVLPIAYRTRYPHRLDYYSFPVNLSYTFMYDESNYNHQNYFRYHRLSAFGSGFIDNHRSPYLSYNVNYKYTNLSFRTREEWDYYFQWKSNLVDFTVGENAFILDQKRYPKWGEGFYIGFKPSYFLIEQTFLRELYKDKPYHNATSVGVVWETGNFLREPEQYVKIRHYQKNSRANDGEVWVFGDHKSTEYQKYILETQLRITDEIKLHFEVYSADDKQAEEYTNAAFTTEATYNTVPVFNKFSLLYDNLDINNETSKKEHFANELNIYTDYFRLYTHLQYSDEAHQPNWTGHYKHTAHNEFANLYVNLYKDFIFRTKTFYTESRTKEPNDFKFTETEATAGIMYKSRSLETELLAGVKEEKFGTAETNAQLIDFNISFSSGCNFTLYNRAYFTDEAIDIISQANFYSAWTDKISQSTGVYNAYYEQSDWKNYFSIYTYLYYITPWKHNIRFGGSYSLNPYFTNHYRYSMLGEYSIPITAKILPKIGGSNRNIYLLDPWQRKPVTNAVFEIENQYFITNDAGQIRLEREKLKTSNIRIINLPEEYTVSRDLSSLADSRSKDIELVIIEYAKLKVNVKKLTYQRVSPSTIRENDSIAYYQSQLVNINRSSLVPFTERLEIILRNKNDKNRTIRGLCNEEGFVIFDKMPVGQWEVLVNLASVTDSLLYDTENVVDVNPYDYREINIIVKEDVTKFIRYEK